MDLRGRNFNGANLSEVIANGTNLSQCTFEGGLCSGLIAKGANCQNAKFVGMVQKSSFVEANLAGASFFGVFFTDVDFSEANLSGVDFRNARFLGGTKFQQAVISEETDFEGATASRELSRLDVFRNFEYGNGKFTRRASTSEGAIIHASAALGASTSALVAESVDGADGTVPTGRAGTFIGAQSVWPTGAQAVGSAGQIRPSIISQTPFQPVDWTPSFGLGSAETSTAIYKALEARPLLIRDNARALAAALNTQAIELQYGKPNEPDKLAEYESLVAFTRKTSEDLQVFADAIDAAIQTGSEEHPEPIFLGQGCRDWKSVTNWRDGSG